MKQEDIDRFIERNLKNFSVNSTGWKELISQMLFEVAIGGWNIKNDVFGKEQLGKLRCIMYSEDENLNAILRKITNKYSILSARTCEICGSEGKMRTIGSWETTLCLNHFLEQQPVIDIDENLNVRRQGKVVLNLEDISKAEVEYDLQELWLHIKSDEDEPVHFSWLEPNYYLLLKSVPLHWFPKDSQDAISVLFNDLKCCEICGYKAVHGKDCLRCHHEPWNEDGCFVENHEDRSSYIKSCQMDIFLDEDDYEKYFKHDRSFEKSSDHQVLFTYQDLMEYEKLLF